MPRFFDLPWDHFVRVVFTRFAMAARTHFHGVDWNWPFMLSMLERLNFDEFFEFRDMFLWWAVGSTAASAVIARRHDDHAAPSEPPGRVAPGQRLHDDFGDSG